MHGLAWIMSEILYKLSKDGSVVVWNQLDFLGNRWISERRRTSRSRRCVWKEIEYFGLLSKVGFMGSIEEIATEEGSMMRGEL